MLWITGAKGLLGSALLKRCKAVLHSGHELDIGQLDQLRQFARQHPIANIVNCAAYNQVDRAELEREEAYRTNVIGPENLAIVAREIGAKLIHLSSDYVFPGTGNRPLTELDPVAPCNYYGQTKLEGEQRALALGSCVIRTSWVFGQGGRIFVSKLLETFQKQKEVCLTYDQWGRFTYAPDLAGAILQMLGKSGLYQFANTGVATRYEFGLAMLDEARKLGYPIVTESILPVPGSYFPTPCKRPTYSAFDTSKIESILTIRPWREALKEFLCEPIPACS